MRFRIGETVKTPDNRVGFVMDKRSFKDELQATEDEGVDIFVQHARATHGPSFQTRYVRVLVSIGSLLKWYMAKDLELIGSRGGKNEDKQAEAGGSSVTGKADAVGDQGNTDRAEGKEGTEKGTA